MITARAMPKERKMKNENEKRKIYCNRLFHRNSADIEMVLHRTSNEQMGKRAVQKRRKLYRRSLRGQFDIRQKILHIPRIK